MSRLILLNMPIGNPDDITQRCLAGLRSGETFLVEDTRSFKSFLSYWKIPLEGKTILSFHDHSNERSWKAITHLFESKKEVYLASEAGSPVLSDPAYPLVRYCFDNQIEIESYSGVSSVTMALELSAFPAHPFHFYGFFPRENSKRQQVIDEIRSQRSTHIFFESVRRLDQCLSLLAENFPDDPICICREMSKEYQSTYHFKAQDYQQALQQMTLKGEFVVLLNRQLEPGEKHSAGPLHKLALQVLESRGKKKDLAKLLAELLGQDVGELYKQLM